jgi:hypothetical protein
LLGTPDDLRFLQEKEKSSTLKGRLTPSGDTGMSLLWQ